MCILPVIVHKRQIHSNLTIYLIFIRLLIFLKHPLNVVLFYCQSVLLFLLQGYKDVPGGQWVSVGRLGNVGKRPWHVQTLFLICIWDTLWNVGDTWWHFFYIFWILVMLEMHNYRLGYVYFIVQMLAFFTILLDIYYATLLINIY